MTVLHAFTFSAVARKAMLDGATSVDLLNGGSVVIYDGNVATPANADAALGGATVLATLTLGNPAFGSATSATPSVKTANAITGANAVATAVNGAAFFRAFKSDGTTVICQGSVGTSGQDLVINSVMLTSGAAVTASSFTISL